MNNNSNYLADDINKIMEVQLRIDKLAAEVLNVSRNTLLVNLRFLDAALAQFKPVPNGAINFGTNGEHVVYNPRHILTVYKTEKEMCVRNYLHMVMHCIFRHMYGAYNMDRRLWDIACDIAVEYSISGLNLKSATVANEAQRLGKANEIKGSVKILTAEKIYRYLLDKNYSEQKLDELAMLFHGDDHDLWYMTGNDGSDSRDGEDGEGDNSNGNGNGNNSDAQSDGNQDDSDGDGSGNNDSPRSAQSNRSVQENVWKDISEQVQMDLETFAKSIGDTAGGMVQNLAAVNREKYDYTSFLNKFAVLGEVMKINDDEFDYIFYTYGLSLYDNMPLIEPLEYKEVKRIREFVIAIDTSGSVCGDEVQSFVQKTYNILKFTESFFSKINLHIIQCDADIQEHVKITSQDEFDDYIRSMQIKGMGGTDFRPVFAKVDELIKNHEFVNLKGLIYFTDGYGIFPKKKPDYETAFVFVNDEYEQPEVPSWAIKLVLQREEI